MADGQENEILARLEAMEGLANAAREVTLESRDVMNRLLEAMRDSLMSCESTRRVHARMDEFGENLTGMSENFRNISIELARIDGIKSTVEEIKSNQQVKAEHVQELRDEMLIMKTRYKTVAFAIAVAFTVFGGFAYWIVEMAEKVPKIEQQLEYFDERLDKLEDKK